MVSERKRSIDQFATEVLQNLSAASFHYETLSDDYSEDRGMAAFYGGMCAGLLMARMILMNTGHYGPKQKYPNAD